MLTMIRYHVVLNLREKITVFWTLVFPLVLGLFFYFGIGGVDESSQFAPIPAAYLGREEEDPFREMLEGLSGEIVIPYYGLTEQKAEDMLEEGTLMGIFRNEEDTIGLTVGKTGMEESILAGLLDGYLQQSHILEDIREQMEPTPQAQKAYGELLDSLQEDSRDYVKEVSLGGNEVSSVTAYYFALLAMACLYMCFLGETAAKRTQANISEIGKRISVSPCHRLKIVLANFLSAYLIALVNIALVMGFLICVLGGIDISMHPGYATVTAMMGCLIGVAFGILIESIGKWSQNIKSTILIGGTIFCAFLAGLMIGTMKDLVEKHAPIVNRLNPAALIADSFYCICVYDDMERLTGNLILMGIMSGIFLLGAWLLTRRVRYDSL